MLARILGLERLPEQNSWGMASIKQYQQRGIQVKEYVADLIGLKTLGVNVVIIAQEKLFKFSSFDDEDSSLPQDALDVIAPLVGSDTGESIYRWLNAAADYICQTCIRPQVKTVTKSVGKGEAKKEVTRETPTGKFDYCLRIGPSDVFTTGFRTSQDIELPQFITNPTYEKITKLL